MKQQGMSRSGAREVVNFFSGLSTGRVSTPQKMVMVELLNELSEREACVRNSQLKGQYEEWLAQWQARNGTNAKPRRNPFPARGALNFSVVDFRSVLGCADKLLSVYFDTSEKWGNTVRGRYVLSVARALEIMGSSEAHTYGTVMVAPGFNFAYDPIKRHSLWSRLVAERERFVAEGVWPDSIEALKRELSSKPSYTISDCLKGNARALVMLSVLAKLMVGCAKDEPAVWERDTLFNVYEHVLSASVRLYDVPYPFHLDAKVDYFRLGRTHMRQCNMVSDYVDAKYYDSSEAALFAGFVMYYIQKRDDRRTVWKAIAGNERMAKFFTPVLQMEIAKAIERDRPRRETNTHER